MMEDLNNSRDIARVQKSPFKRGRAKFYQVSETRMREIIDKSPTLKNLISRNRTYRDVWIAFGHPTIVIKGSNKFL